MNSGNKDARGGARPGAGRPRLEYDRAELLEAVKRKTESTGRSIATELVEMAYDDDKRIRLAAIKLVYQMLGKPAESHSSTQQFPSTDSGLPNRRPDPARVVPLIRPETD
jgi:hypothetical protein